MSDAATRAYRVLSTWGPPSPTDDAEGSDVAVDSRDNVYILTKPAFHYDCMAPGQLARTPSPDGRPRLDSRPAARHHGRVLVYDRQGGFRSSWGEGVLGDQPHGITIGPDDTVYIALRDDNTVRRYTLDGRQLAVIGTSGVPSDSGIDWSIRDNELRRQSIKRGGPPFNNPTKLALAPDGQFYVADGYANARVHRFAASGALVTSWGEPGTSPGEFRLPHSVAVTEDGRVFVADRENNRIQIFARDGAFLETWPIRSNALVIDSEGYIYFDSARGISIVEPSGRQVARIDGGKTPLDPDYLTAPHGLATDSQGSIYVALLGRPSGHDFWRMVRKFERVA